MNRANSVHPVRSPDFPPAAVLTLLMLSLIPNDAWAMRCGSKVISKGDIQAKVLRFCGDPVQTMHRSAVRSGVYGNYRVPRSVSVAPDNSTRERVRRNYHYGHSEVIVEEWIYNLGPHKLMRKITFENGVVRKVETLERGYRD